MAGRESRKVAGRLREGGGVHVYLVVGSVNTRLKVGGKKARKMRRSTTSVGLEIKNTSKKENKKQTLV